MQATITPASIYRAIFAGQTVSVACPEDKFKSLRSAVQREHQTPRALDLTSDSLSASFNKDKGIATFRLAPRRVATGFQIIEITDEPGT